MRLISVLILQFFILNIFYSGDLCAQNRNVDVLAAKHIFKDKEQTTDLCSLLKEPAALEIIQNKQKVKKIANNRNVFPQKLEQRVNREQRGIFSIFFSFVKRVLKIIVLRIESFVNGENFDYKNIILEKEEKERKEKKKREEERKKIDAKKKKEEKLKSNSEKSTKTQIKKPEHCKAIEQYTNKWLKKCTSPGKARGKVYISDNSDFSVVGDIHARFDWLLSVLGEFGELDSVNPYSYYDTQKLKHVIGLTYANAQKDKDRYVYLPNIRITNPKNLIFLGGVLHGHTNLGKECFYLIMDVLGKSSNIEMVFGNHELMPYYKSSCGAVKFPRRDNAIERRNYFNAILKRAKENKIKIAASQYGILFSHSYLTETCLKYLYSEADKHGLSKYKKNIEYFYDVNSNAANNVNFKSQQYKNNLNKLAEYINKIFIAGLNSTMGAPQDLSKYSVIFYDKSKGYEFDNPSILWAGRAVNPVCANIQMGYGHLQNKRGHIGLGNNRNMFCFDYRAKSGVEPAFARVENGKITIYKPQSNVGNNIVKKMRSKKNVKNSIVFPELQKFKQKNNRENKDMFAIVFGFIKKLVVVFITKIIGIEQKEEKVTVRYRKSEKFKKRDEKKKKVIKEEEQQEEQEQTEQEQIDNVLEVNENFFTNEEPIEFNEEFIEFNEEPIEFMELKKDKKDDFKTIEDYDVEFIEEEEFFETEEETLDLNKVVEDVEINKVSLPIIDNDKVVKTKPNLEIIQLKQQKSEEKEIVEKETQKVETKKQESKTVEKQEEIIKTEIIKILKNMESKENGNKLFDLFTIDNLKDKFVKNLLDFLHQARQEVKDRGNKFYSSFAVRMASRGGRNIIDLRARSKIRGLLENFSLLNKDIISALLEDIGTNAENLEIQFVDNELSIMFVKQEGKNILKINSCLKYDKDLTDKEKIEAYIGVIIDMALRNMLKYRIYECFDFKDIEKYVNPSDSVKAIKGYLTNDAIDEFTAKKIESFLEKDLELSNLMQRESSKISWFMQFINGSLAKTAKAYKYLKEEENVDLSSKKYLHVLEELSMKNNVSLFAIKNMVDENLGFNDMCENAQRGMTVSYLKVKGENINLVQKKTKVKETRLENIIGKNKKSFISEIEGIKSKIKINKMFNRDLIETSKLIRNKQGLKDITLEKMAEDIACDVKNTKYYFAKMNKAAEHCVKDGLKIYANKLFSSENESLVWKKALKTIMENEICHEHVENRLYNYLNVDRNLLDQKGEASEDRFLLEKQTIKQQLLIQILYKGKGNLKKGIEWLGNLVKAYENIEDLKGIQWLGHILEQEKRNFIYIEALKELYDKLKDAELKNKGKLTETNIGIIADVINSFDERFGHALEVMRNA